MGSDDFYLLIASLAVAQLFIALYNFMIAIINGMMDVRRLASMQVSGALVALSIICSLSYMYQLSGALYGYILGQVSMFFVATVFFVRSSYFDKSLIRPRFNADHFKRLALFSTMTLTSALLAPLVQLMVRNELAEQFSWEEVGYWQAVAKVSDAYLLFFTTAISIYYLPKLSAVSDKAQFVKEIKCGYAFIMPIVLLFSFLVYVFREYVTLVLYSDQFLAAVDLYLPQLIGDSIKIASFLLSFIMLAKAMTKTYLFSELFFSFTYVGWVILLSNYYGLIGAMYAFIVNYIIYFLFASGVTLRFIRGM